MNRAVPHGIQPVQIASGDLQGKWLLLDLQVDKDLWLGNYEPDLAEAIFRFARPAGIAYDLGANVGYSTLLLARAVGPSGHVVAFEPLPNNAERLVRAVVLNGLESVITVVPAAVGAEAGRSEFLIHESGGMGRLAASPGREDGFVGALPVDVVTLDEFVFRDRRPPPQVIKMDLEGGEGGALRGMRRLLRELRPCLLIELHGLQASAEVVRELSDAGYRMHRMGGDDAELLADSPESLPRRILAMAAGTSV
jgi:FkbM family methyltransferase